MQEFLDSLKAGKFMIPVCRSCSYRVWPPSRSCPACLSETAMQEVETIGNLVEFSTSHVRAREGVFGVIDMGGIRLVGGLKEGKLVHGMKVKMSTCGLSDDGSPYYDFLPAETRH